MLYAIGDLHLSLNTDKPMDVFGAGWENYVEKIENGFSKLHDEDICVICGDISWGMDLEDSLKDFQFIDRLPGKKIILKGNHDYWWNTVTKIERFFKEKEITTIQILHNNCYFYEDAAICGTRGWVKEEPGGDAQNRKVLAREAGRLEASLKAAGETAEKLCFFHYPPRFNGNVTREMTELMTKYGVRDCWYGHIHGNGHRFAFTGEAEGVGYHMVSADYLRFEPLLIR